jgi:hypothetical protein
MAPTRGKEFVNTKHLGHRREEEKGYRRHRKDATPVKIANMVVSARNEVLEAARRYHAMGLNVIPIGYGTKKPTIKWEKYQTSRVTPAEIDEWFGNADEPVNIAIICGSISGNLVVFDFDNPENYSRFFPDPANVEQQTPVVQTARGIHVWYRSFRETPKFKVPGLVDVQGEGSYVIAPPSIHPSGAKYEFKNPQVTEPLLVDNAEETVWEHAKKLGHTRDDISFIGDDQDPPCIRAALRGVEKPGRNEIGIRLAAYWLYKRHESRDVTWDLLRAWNRRNKPDPLPDIEIRSIMKSAIRGGKVAEYGCNAWRDMGDQFCSQQIMKTCPIANQLRVVQYAFKQVASAVLSDGRIVEEGYDGATAYFIVYDPKSGKIDRVDRIIDDDAKIHYEPLMNRDVETSQVLLPTEAVEYGSDQELLDEIVTFMNHWHEQPDPNERLLDALYAFMTYLRDLLPQVCYRRALGDWGTAKSTFVETLGAACYRPFFTAGCSSEASLRRTFDLWQGTALIDEADFSKRSDLFAPIMRIMNIGYDARFGWYRCCDDKDPTKILSFYVFAPKILATRKRFPDRALESRCQTFMSQENRSPVPLFRLRQFVEGGLRIRNKLLMWRFKNYNAFKERITNTMEDPAAYEELYGKDSKISSRIKQITFPLSLVASPAMRETIKQFAEEHDALLKSLDQDRVLGEQIRGYLEAKVAGVAAVAALGRPLEIPTADISKAILGEAESPDDKDYMREFKKEQKALTTRVNEYFADHTSLKLVVGLGGLKRVQIPWGLPIGDTTATGATLSVGKDSEYEAELIFPHKIALKARKDPGQQKLAGPTEKERSA